jgi:zinc ribbon protein
MSLTACPACGKQVSSQAPTCPQCGHPIALHPPATPSQPPPSPTTGGGSGAGCIFLGLIALAVGVFFAFTNPTEADMRQKIAQDGWAPVGFERTNLIVFNWVSVTGFTGAKAKYLGIAKGIFKID